MQTKINVITRKPIEIEDEQQNASNHAAKSSISSGCRRIHAPGYVYMGQHYSNEENNCGKEMQRITLTGWAAYAKYRVLFKSNICMERDYEQLLRAVSNEADRHTWTIAKQTQNKLAATQTKMERTIC